jgi:hypothetical protein
MPRGLYLNEEQSVYRQEAEWLDFSWDLSRLAFGITGPDVPAAPRHGKANFYLAGPDPFARPTWLAQPTAEKPTLENNLSVVGGTPDLSTVYFAYEGHLLPVDENTGDPEGSYRVGWGLYEYREGRLSYAGVLPDGSVSAYGAVPAGIAAGSEIQGKNEGMVPGGYDNQLSGEGTRLLFVSPDPLFFKDQSTKRPPELYMRVTAADGSQSTVLVSRSELAGHVGEAAVDGVALFPNAMPEAVKGNSVSVYGEYSITPAYAYASPDGSRVFFASTDRLTEDAPVTTAVKMYRFDVDSGSLEYLPGVLGGIVAAAPDGSWIVFENSATSPFELDRWSEGPGGGSVTPIVQLSGPHVCDGLACVGPARLVADGGVLVFTSESPIAGFNDAGGFKQAFRYDFARNELACVSCPPHGINPSGDAYISYADEHLGYRQTGHELFPVGDDRGASSDGTRVFFDTPDPLVPQDSNGARDVYEWENGRVFLISSGTSVQESKLQDNSESGGDVFFATTSELVAGDNDLAYDVYDARVPRPGDNPPPSSVPCQGDVCQGPPSVPSLLGLPASATFSGVGNVEPQAEPRSGAVVKKVRSKHKAKRKKKRGKAGHRAGKAGVHGKGRGK